ncbi:MAG: phosphoglycerate kinase [Saprospirales bacterium]|nr:MAG: phosphoglycerate kinase [Saprospirales bacterium]
MELQNLNLQGKKVLIRADLNTPIRDGKVTDNSRILGSLATIRFIHQNGASVILMSHLGRPEKKLLPDGNIDKQTFSLKPVADELKKHLSGKVVLAADVAGADSKKQAAELKTGDVLVLENTRFEDGEKSGSEELAQRMAELADCYVNDAFGTAHRAHASTTTVSKFFKPDQRAFGFLMQKELEEAKKITVSPERPYTVILGGAKVSDKILLIEKLMEKADNILIGGGMAYTFLYAKGGNIGKSLCEKDKVNLVLEILEKAKKRGVQIYLPADAVGAKSIDEKSPVKEFPADKIEDEFMGLDVGPLTSKIFREKILQSKTIFWNGPMGVFELAPFSKGTIEVAKSIAQATKNGGYSLIGGGDSVAAVNQFGMQDRMSFLSTGGGAMLTLLEGSSLPAVEAMIRS